jgi:hypothetical protein
MEIRHEFIGQITGRRFVSHQELNSCLKWLVAAGLHGSIQFKPAGAIDDTTNCDEQMMEPRSIILRSTRYNEFNLYRVSTAVLAM